MSQPSRLPDRPMPRIAPDAPDAPNAADAITVGEPSPAELRSTSDRLLDTLERLRELEYRKREVEPGGPEFVRLAREVESLAREALGTSGEQVELGEQAAWAATHGRPEVAETPINHMPPPRDVAQVLAEWRDAERRQGEARPGSAEAKRARADADRLRDEYRRFVESSDG